MRTSARCFSCSRSTEYNAGFCSRHASRISRLIRLRSTARLKLRLLTDTSVWHGTSSPNAVSKCLATKGQAFVFWPSANVASINFLDESRSDLGYEKDGVSGNVVYLP